VVWDSVRKPGYQTYPKERRKEKYAISTEQRGALTSLASPTFIFYLQPSGALLPSRSELFSQTQNSSESLQADEESEKNSGIGGKADMSPLRTKMVSSPSEAVVSSPSETADS